jgi:hypothetical protein
MMNIAPNTPVLAKLVDGTFVIGTKGEDSITDCYTLMLRQGPDGNVGVAITDFHAPFIQDGKGIAISYKDILGPLSVMPESLQSEYLSRKTGIVLATSMPTNNPMGRRG